MKKFDIECATKIKLEQALFKRRMLEQEIRMKELETKHQLLEKKRELERKVKRTGLEIDDVVRNQLVLETSHPSTAPQKMRWLRVGW